MNKSHSEKMMEHLASRGSGNAAALARHALENAKRYNSCSLCQETQEHVEELQSEINATMTMREESRQDAQRAQRKVRELLDIIEKRDAEIKDLKTLYGLKKHQGSMLLKDDGRCSAYASTAERCPHYNTRG